MHYHHKNQEGQDISTDDKRTIYSYDYYYEKLHFCKPEHVEKAGVSIGSVLFGDRLYNSPFQLNMLKNKTCERLCNSTIIGRDAKFINKLIKNGYYQNWLIDGLPAAREVYDTRTKSNFYGNGFELGLVEIRQTTGEKLLPNSADTFRDLHKRDAKNIVQNLMQDIEVPYFVNHFDIRIEYHDRGNDNYRVVGVTVNPVSIDRSPDGGCKPTGKALSLSESEVNYIHFTYSVEFIPSETAWVTRWDKYLHVYDPTIQWVSIVNFSIVVIILSCAVARSLLQALKSDFSRYGELNLDETIKEDASWKLGHGDVFRAPDHPMLLSILVGSGVQLFLMIICTIFLPAVGLITPGSRGTLPTVMFLLYLGFSFISSFVSMGVYKFFNGQKWHINCILTPFLVPGLLLLVIIGLNIFLIFVHSSGVIPLATFTSLILLWFFIGVPLSITGSLMARKTCHWDIHPTKTNTVSKVIPPQKWYLQTIPASLIGGLFSFGSLSVELYFVYTSLWFNKIFYMYGFLFGSAILFTLTVSLVTVLFTYYSLSAENWQWQWRSFLIAGLGCSFYVFLHSLLFTEVKLGGFTNALLYMGYSFVITSLAFVVTGALGFLSSMLFVRTIYSAVKVD
ncbi:Tmn2p NDAI_0J01420 [Naumovozyma dairenensis CBS 421]|uniref:Transmembrane 9 superfamily member n=1 Tax=Naumovozyma dairenensis (strain ATCC 10597 / BCRC 20456 / CBS 421 / NBRC 0211 / NRRL Y-12639) TaxID=1071378 RepID=G0WGV6_NAUDC|nr:hypothetical protein NDAI_0J01420 [Naumovozyma dairenensis CBS 421]CCD27034.1 hypothetical protein NDAI_0J01420 [Naumovozyma dairenensis CBS 421]